MSDREDNPVDAQVGTTEANTGELAKDTDNKTGEASIRISQDP